MSDASTAPTSRPVRRRPRRSDRLNRTIAVISWSLGGAALAFGIWIAIQGKLNPYSVLNVLFAVLGCAISGILALSGDGDVVLFTGLDEGQRDAITKAAACAFGFAFWGLFILWIAWQITPAWRAAADVQVGVLLVLVLLIYLLGYLRQRRYS